MNDFPHPFIFCRHRLKVKNFEQLAKELAVKLNLKLTAEYHSRFKITYENPNYSNEARLIEKKSNLIPQLKYHLIINDFTAFVYKDFFEILVNFDVNYYQLLVLHKKDEMKRIDFLINLFQLLHLLGVSEIYVGIFNEFGKDKKIKYACRNVFEKISSLPQHFKVEILKNF